MGTDSILCRVTDPRPALTFRLSLTCMPKLPVTSAYASRPKDSGLGFSNGSRVASKTAGRVQGTMPVVCHRNSSVQRNLWQNEDGTEGRTDTDSGDDDDDDDDGDDDDGGDEDGGGGIVLCCEG